MTKPKAPKLPATKKPAKGKTPPKTYTMAQKLRDPNKRKGLPDSALNPMQLANRKRIKQVAKNNANPLYNPQARLTGDALYNAAKQVTDLDYDGQIEALERKGKDQTTQGTALASRAGGYYKQLAEKEAGHVARQTALGAMLKKGIGETGARAQAQLQQSVDADAERVKADTTLRGSGLGGGGEAAVAGEVKGLSARASAGQRANEGLADLQTSNWANLSGALGKAREMRGGEIQGQLLNRLANAQVENSAQTASKRGEKGGAFVKTLLGMRDKEFENAAVSSQLDLDQEKLQTDASLKAAGIKSGERKAILAAQTSKQNAQLAAQTSRGNAQLGAETSRSNAQLGATTSRENTESRNAQSNKNSERTNSNKGGAGKPSAQDRKLYGNIDSWGSFVSSMKAKHPGEDRNQIRNRLLANARQKGETVDQMSLAVALDIGVTGHVSPATLGRIKAAGLRPSSAWPRRSKPAGGNRRT